MRSIWRSLRSPTTTSCRLTSDTTGLNLSRVTNNLEHPTGAEAEVKLAPDGDHCRIVVLRWPSSPVQSELSYFNRSRPMFLTLEDERARIKGSRDPLGTQLIWTEVGRQMVTNLTTVTTSLRGFTTLLLARYYAEKLIEEGKAKEEDALPLFLRFEQIAAYAREVVHAAGGG